MEHCPACTQRIPTLVMRQCPHCGVDMAAFNSIRQIKEDFQRLLSRLQHLETLFTPKPEPKPEPERRSPPSPPPGYEPPPPPPPRREPPPPRMNEVQLGQKWLLVIGVIVTLFGLGYFLKYSFDQNWIGPAGRVALCYLGAAVFLAVGEICRRGTLETFGLYLIGGGVGALYLCTFAAFQVWSLLTQEAAFGLMVLVTVFAGILSLAYDRMALAVLGLVGGFVTPLLVSTGTANQVALMTYLTILNGGVLWLSFHKRWDLLNQLGFFFTWVLFAGFYGRYYTPERLWITLGFATLFFLIYALAPFLYYFVRPCRTPTRGIWITVPNALIGFGYSYAAIREVYGTYPVAAVSLVYAILFFGFSHHLLRRNPESRPAIVLMLAKAVLFLVLTVPLLFSRHWITVFWMVQAVTVLWAALRLDNRWLFRGAFLLGALALLKLFLHDWNVVFDVRWRGITLWIRDGYLAAAFERWITHAVTVAALYAGATLCRRAGRRDFRRGLATLNGLLVFLFLHLEVGGYFHDYLPEATFAALSVYWAVFSIAAMCFGFARNVAGIRKCALGLFGITVVKVFLFDMANVSTPFRVLSFIVLGLLLIAASYLYYRFRDRIAEEKVP